MTKVQNVHILHITLKTYKFRLVLVDGQRGVVHGGAHGALFAELPLLLLAQRVHFFIVHNVFGKEWHFSLLQLICNLCGNGVLVFSRLPFRCGASRKQFIVAFLNNVSPIMC